jgi:hypothetical protein
VELGDQEDEVVAAQDGGLVRPGRQPGGEDRADLVGVAGKRDERSQGHRDRRAEGQGDAPAAAPAQGPDAGPEREDVGGEDRGEVDEIAAAGVESREPAGVLAAGFDEREEPGEEGAAVDRRDLEPAHRAAGGDTAQGVQQLVDRHVDPPAEDEADSDEREAAVSLPPAPGSGQATLETADDVLEWL